jgi:hypothetical protein
MTLRKGAYASGAYPERNRTERPRMRTNICLRPHSAEPLDGSTPRSWTGALVAEGELATPGALPLCQRACALLDPRTFFQNAADGAAGCYFDDRWARRAACALRKFTARCEGAGCR